LVYEFQINRPIPKQNYIIEEEKQKAALLKLIIEIDIALNMFYLPNYPRG